MGAFLSHSIISLISMELGWVFYDPTRRYLVYKAYDRIQGTDMVEPLDGFAKSGSARSVSRCIKEIESTVAKERVRDTVTRYRIVDTKTGRTVYESDHR